MLSNIWELIFRNIVMIVGLGSQGLRNIRGLFQHRSVQRLNDEQLKIANIAAAVKVAGDMLRICSQYGVKPSDLQELLWMVMFWPRLFSPLQFAQHSNERQHQPKCSQRKALQTESRNSPRSPLTTDKRRANTSRKKSSNVIHKIK